MRRHSFLASDPVAGAAGMVAEIAIALVKIAVDRGLGLVGPMAGLDNGYQQKLLAQLAALARDGCRVLVSTHNPEHALQVGSSVAVLERGRIAADGPQLEIVTAETIELARGVRRLLPPTCAAS